MRGGLIRGLSGAPRGLSFAAGFARERPSGFAIRKDLSMPPRFGTSGLRGLVSELTDALVADYTRAFLAACPHGGALWLGQDLRPS